MPVERQTSSKSGFKRSLGLPVHRSSTVKRQNLDAALAMNTPAYDPNTQQILSARENNSLKRYDAEQRSAAAGDEVENKHNCTYLLVRSGWMCCFLGVVRAVSRIHWILERRVGLDLPPGGELVVEMRAVPLELCELFLESVGFSKGAWGWLFLREGRWLWD